jgi:hypothetical protein
MGVQWSIPLPLTLHPLPFASCWFGCGTSRSEVKVARKGARVLYRRGYYAREQLIPYDRRQFMTLSRMLTAMAHPEDLDDMVFLA